MTQSDTSDTTANGNSRRRASERANAPDDLQGAPDSPATRIRNGASAAAEALPEAFDRLRGTVDTVSERFPEAVESARVTARETADSFRGLPEPTRRSLAALSLGLGIGLALAGAPRLITMAALTPALISAMIATVDESGKARPSTSA
jgi:hypothetical protein